MRQNLQVNPGQKLFDAYNDFSGGWNTDTANERMRDNEFPIFDNVDLIGRGSLRRRTGRTKVITIPAPAQGVFTFFRQGQSGPDKVFAGNGALYVLENGATVLKNAVMSGGNFQTAKPVEAVQVGTSLFLATGTSFMELNYSGGTWTATVSVPYKPTDREAIFIGTNALAADPDAYIQDGVTAALQIVGIKPSKRTGVVNQVLNLITYISKPAGMASVLYKWEYKKVSDTAWTLGKDFTADAGGKTWAFTPSSAGSYDIQLTVKENPGGTPVTYQLNGYTVNVVEDPTNTDLPVSGVQRCTKILLHYDRLIMAGDPDYPFQLYISHLNNPRYFPRTNSASFDGGKQEAITTTVRYRDTLIVQTPTTTHVLAGRSPADYKKVLVNNSVGCVSGRTAQVVGNVLLFRAVDGVYSLSPSPLVLTDFNVRRIDRQIQSKIPGITEDACAVYAENQYWLCFPGLNVIYRYYYETGIWVRDVSTKLNILQFLTVSGTIFELASTGNVYIQDKDVYTDDGETYEMVCSSKDLDFEAAFNQKKLKRLYVLARHYADLSVDIEVRVYADTAIILSPETGHAEVQAGYVEWVSQTQPNMHFFSGTILGEWMLGVNPLGTVSLSVQKASIRGKCRRTRIEIRHKQDSPCEIYGFGFEYKMKKP